MSNFSNVFFTGRGVSDFLVRFSIIVYMLWFAKRVPSFNWWQQSYEVVMAGTIGIIMMIIFISILFQSIKYLSYKSIEL